MASGGAGEAQQERLQGRGSLQCGRALGCLPLPIPRKLLSPSWEQGKHTRIEVLVAGQLRLMEPRVGELLGFRLYPGARGILTALTPRFHFLPGASPCSPTVLFQQTTADPQHPDPAGRSCYLLPALLTDLLREVAPDHLPGSDPLQQLLRLLQAAAGPAGAGQSLFLCCQQGLRAEVKLKLLH